MGFIGSELHGAEPGQDYDQTIPCDQRRDAGRSRAFLDHQSTWRWPHSVTCGLRSACVVSPHGRCRTRTAFVGGAVGRDGDPCGLLSRLISATTISAHGVSCPHPSAQFTRVRGRRENGSAAHLPPTGPARQFSDLPSVVGVSPLMAATDSASSTATWWRRIVPRARRRRV